MRTTLWFAALLFASPTGTAWQTSTGGSWVWTEDAKILTEELDPYGTVGWATSISGDTFITGAFRAASSWPHAGSAYVFVRSGSAWVQEATLEPSDGGHNDFFGYRVGISGDTAVVGSPFKSSDRGAAYVFERSGTAWSEVIKLPPGWPEIDDNFGRAVAIDGDTIVVGAPNSNHGGYYSAGSVEVYVRSGSTWSREAVLIAAVLPSGRLGWSVAISGDTIVAGAVSHSGAETYTGGAYVFVRSGTTWSEEALISPSDLSYADNFGYTVAIDGETALIGAPGDDDVAPDAGALHVFTRSGSSWTRQAKLTSSDLGATSALGTSVSIHGDNALGGAAYADIGGADSGAAYLFTRTGSTWAVVEEFAPADGRDDEGFGTSVAVTDELALVGCPFDYLGTAGDVGSVYEYGKHQTVGDTFCSGDLVGLCPCGNPGGPDEGCVNSTGLGTSLLAVGQAVVGNDTVVLHAEHCPPNAFGLFFSGANALSGLPFGDGLRCTGGQVMRVELVQASLSGVALSSTSISAKEGLSGGELRHYQYWYRDPSGPCGGEFNATNGVAIQW